MYVRKGFEDLAFGDVELSLRYYNGTLLKDELVVKNVRP